MILLVLTKLSRLLIIYQQTEKLKILDNTMDFGNFLTMKEKNLMLLSPLLKSICVVHSTANAYKDLCKTVPEIEHLVKKLSGTGTFFHASAKRTSDLDRGVLPKL